MLKQFSIKNFKSYGKNAATFDLSKITFVYGNNSVGKSTFLEALKIIDDAWRKNHGIVIRSDGFKNGVIAADDEWNLKCSGANGIDVSWTLSLNDVNDWVLKDDANGGLVAGQVFNQSFPQVTHVKAGDTRKNAAVGLEALAAKMEDPESSLMTQEQVADVNQMFDDLDVHYQCAVDGTLTDLDFDMPNLVEEKVGTGIRGIYRYLVKIAKWKSGLLLLEEPEANVNESQLQRLAQLLVHKAIDRASADSNMQMVVECHSEHILLEVLGMVADGKLKAEDVSVVYVMKTSVGSEATTCRIDANGSLDRWPDANGFFTARKRILFGENDEP